MVTEGSNALAARDSISIRLSSAGVERILSGSREEAPAGVLDTSRLIASPETSPNATGSSSGDSALRGDTRMAPYLELIRMLAKDEKLAQEAIQRIESFSKNPGDSEATASSYSNASMRIEVQESATLRVSITGVSMAELQTAVESLFGVNVEVEGELVDPLVIDFTGEGIRLSDAKNGALFDLNGDGIRTQSAFVLGGTAFLALDRNGNGVIDDGRELFGDQHGARDGFEELRKFDDNGDGVIDERDVVFDQLRLLFRSDLENSINAHSMMTLREAGIIALDLNAQSTNEKIAGNLLSATSSYIRDDGARGTMGNVWLSFLA